MNQPLQRSVGGGFQYGCEGPRPLSSAKQEVLGLSVDTSLMNLMVSWSFVMVLYLALLKANDFFFCAYTFLVLVMEMVLSS